MSTKGKTKVMVFYLEEDAGRANYHQVVARHFYYVDLTGSQVNDHIYNVMKSGVIIIYPDSAIGRRIAIPPHMIIRVETQNAV